MAESGENIKLPTRGEPPPDEETGTDDTTLEELNIIEGKDLTLPGDGVDFPPVPQDITEEGTRDLDSHARDMAARFREMHASKKLPTDSTPSRARPVIDSRPKPATPVGESRLDASDKRRFKLSLTNDKKKFFLEKLKKRVNKTIGPNSEKLFKQTVLTSKTDDSGYTGLNYNGVEVATVNDDGTDLVFNKTKEATEFKDVFKKAAKEYDASLDAQAFEMIERLGKPNKDDTPDTQPPASASVDEGLRSADIPQEVIDSVMEDTIDDLTDERDNLISNLESKLTGADSEIKDLKSRILGLVEEVNEGREVSDSKNKYIVTLTQDLTAMKQELAKIRNENRNLNDKSLSKITQLTKELEKRQKLIQTKGILTEKEIQDIENIFSDNDKEGRDDQLRSIADISGLLSRTPEEFNENLKGRLDGIDENIATFKAKSAESEDGSPRKIIYDLLTRASEMTKDYLNAKYGRKLETTEGVKIMEEAAERNDLGRYERFKVWARENLGALAAIAISVGGIITTIVIGSRSVLKKGADALGKLGTALWNAAGKVAPVFGALLNLAAQIISLGAKGVAFLAKNLWILILAITYYLYEEWKDRRRRRMRKRPQGANEVKKD